MITVILQYLVWKLAMYQIYKNYPTVVTVVTVVVVVAVVSSEKNHATSPQKNLTTFQKNL